MPVKKLLIVASTFPANEHDTVPAFVKDQAIALKKLHPALEILVLAPHDAQSHTDSFRRHEYYDEYRFHYFWPFRLERLAGHGIVPTLKQHPAYYFLVPFLIGSEFFALLSLSRKQRPDIIYAHWFTPQGITTGIVSGITRIPYVYTSHSSDVAFLRKVPVLGPRLVRMFTRRAQAVTVVSRRSLDKLRVFFDTATWQSISKKVAVIPMGVDIPPTARAARGAGKQSDKILFIGRLVEKKGVQYLLPAFKDILNTHPTATITIAGDGPWLSRLQNQVKELAISEEKVTFTGYVSGKQKADLIDATSTLVVPSIIAAGGDAEGLPVVLMEGLAAGKVCIATNESGADDILTDGKDGFLIPQKDVEALGKALGKALSMDAKQYRAMQHNARATSEQFAWPHVAKQHYDFLLQ